MRILSKLATVFESHQVAVGIETWYDIRFQGPATDIFGLNRDGGRRAVRKEFGNLAKFAPSILLAALLLPMVGCSPEASAPEGDSGVGSLEISDRSSVAPVVFGIGDVETSLDMTLTIDKETDLTNVEFEEVLTRKYEIAKVDVLVRKPYPEELILVLKIKSFDNFVGHAVQIRPHVYFDGKDVALDGFIYGSRAVLNRREFKMNLFEHLEDSPSSTLVHAELEISLFLNTDESEVTLETPPTEHTQTVTKLSNLVRIDFVP